MSATEPAVLRAVDLSVRAGGRSLLERVSFEVRKGEVVLLCAPSGSGKTVLLKVIAGLITRQHEAFEIEGVLEIDCVDILGADAGGTPVSSAGQVGIVFQDYALLQGGTIGSNLAFAQSHRRVPIRGPEADHEAESLAAEIGLDVRLPVEALSGGQEAACRDCANARA